MQITFKSINGTSLFIHQSYCDVKQVMEYQVREKQKCVEEMNEYIRTQCEKMNKDDDDDKDFTDNEIYYIQRQINTNGNISEIIIEP